MKQEMKKYFRKCLIIFEIFENYFFENFPLYSMSHVIHRLFRTQLHENLRRNFRIYMKIYREMVFKDCKAQEIVSFLLRFQAGCTRL